MKRTISILMSLLMLVMLFPFDGDSTTDAALDDVSVFEVASDSNFITKNKLDTPAPIGAKADGSNAIKPKSSSTKAAETAMSGDCGDDLTWTLDDEGTLTISGTGAMGNYFSGGAPWYSMRSSIKKIAICDSVTSIGDSAFYDCNSLTTVTIGDSVTTIGDDAFSDCTSLTEVTIPDSVTTIGDWAFYDCTSLTEVTIGDSVTTIGFEAFSYCTSLTEVTIGDSVTTIEDEAFYDCASLTEVTIGDSVTTIGDYAFSDCTSLTTVTIGDSVTWIGDSAFEYCRSLKAVYITDIASWCGISFDGYDANPLYRAHNLYLNGELIKDLNIPDSVTSIGNYAFDSCTSLSSITIPDSVTSIGNYAFRDCTSLTSVTIGNSVTSIGDSAFYDCTSLTSITLPNSITNIGARAFYGCEALISIIIPNNVTSIGAYAFEYCCALTTITIPNSVTNIGNNAFDDCDAITDVYYDGFGGQWQKLSENSGIPSDAVIHALRDEAGFSFEDGTLSIGTDFAESETYAWSEFAEETTQIIIVNGVTGIPANAFNGFNAVESVKISEDVAAIGEDAFANCDNLTAVYFRGTEAEWKEIGYTFPESVSVHWSCVMESEDWYIMDGILTVTSSYDFTQGSHPWHNYADLFTQLVLQEGVTSIGDSAFYDCTSLTSITLPNSVTSIGDSAFYRCTSLTSITLPDSVTSIGDSAFSACASLEEVTISDSVTTIGRYAFSDCTSLEEVTIGNSMTTIGFWAFTDCTSLKAFTVSADNPSYKDIDGVLFDKACTTLIQYPAGRTETTYTIGDFVTIIGDYAFSDCTSLTTVTIGDSVTTIGYAFSYCDSLEEVTIGDSVTTIGSEAFCYCDSLTTVTIGDSVTTIEDEAFYDCTSLTEIKVSVDNPSYKDIDGVLFDKACTTLIQYPAGRTETTYTIGDPVTTIGEFAFRSCASLEEVTIGDSVTTIGDRAFFYCDSLEEVTIGDSVTTIGDRAFFHCLSLTTVTIGDSVTTIGSAAFSDCPSLTTVTIPDSVTTIGSSAFYNCASLEEVTIPDSVTRIGNYTFLGCEELTSVTIGDSVTTIGSNAFSHCASLEEVTIPDSVTTIGADAFWDCTSLTCAVFVGKPPTSFGEDVFSSCASNFTIYYYLKHKSSWAPNGETTWNGYPLRMIGCDDTVSTDLGNDFVMVLDADTQKPISGASVLVKNGSKTVCEGTTSKDGIIQWKHQSYGNNSDIQVEVSKDKYNQQKTSVTLKDGRISKTVYLIPKGEEKVTGVTCNGSNILTGKKSYERNASTKLSIKVTDTYSESSVSKYELLQDGKIVTSCSDGAFSSFTSDKLAADVPVWLRLKFKNNSYSKPIKLGLTAYNKPFNISQSIEVSLMDKLEVKVPNNVPLIGGQTVSIDLGNVPVVVGISDDMVRFGLGMSNDFDPTNDDLFHELKTSTNVKKMDKGLSQYFASAFGVASAGWSAKPKVEVYGYAEGKLNQDPTLKGSFTAVSGNIVIKASVKFKNEWQTAMWVIPVVIKFSAELGLNNKFSVGYDAVKAEWLISNDIEFVIPKITLSVGAGITQIADISVYGSAANKIGYKTKTKYLYGKLTGEAGLSAKVLFWSDKWPIVSGTWTYYEKYISKSVMKDAEGFSPYDFASYEIISRDYLSKQSAWMGDIAKRDTLSARNATMLQSTIYGGAEPQIVTANGTTVMVYLADDGTRTTGNHTELVYSLYNASNNTWSEPLAVWDDGTADFYPTLATNGSDIYVAWVDANKTFGDDVTMEQMSAACEISVAKLTSNGFAEHQRITSNDTLDMQPTIAFVGNEPVVVWSRNANNDLLAQSGNNAILYAKLGQAETALKSLTTPVYSLSAGILNGTVEIAYVTDVDGDIETIEDMEVYFGGMDGVYAPITDNEVVDAGPIFAKLGNEDCLFWQSAEGLKVFNGNDIVSYEVPIGAGYRVVSNDEMTYLLYSMNEGDGGSLYISQYDAASDSWTEAITLTDTEGYAENPTAIINESNGLLAVYTRTDATVTEDDIITVTDLYSIRMMPSYNLVLNDATFDNDEVVLGEKLPITLSVTNAGEKSVEEFTVTVEGEGFTKQSFILDTALASGETKEVQIDFALPTSASTNGVEISVEPKMEADFTEFNPKDNTVKKQIFLADVSVSVEKLNSGNAMAIQAIVANEGHIAADATLTIRRDTADGEILGTHSIKDLNAGEMQMIRIFDSYLNSLMDGSECLHFSVDAADADANIGNNDDFVTITAFETDEWIESIIYGDVNLDGTVTAADAAMILRSIVGIETLNEQQLLNADMNGDGVVNASDAAEILRKAVGI